MILSSLKYTETQLFYDLMSCYTQFSPMTYRKMPLKNEFDLLNKK